MKGFLVVDRLNDTHFIDTDKEFARHINEQARENGLLPTSRSLHKDQTALMRRLITVYTYCHNSGDIKNRPEYKDMYTVDPNIVMQQFSPLIMSQWFLIDHAQNPCASILCENNFLFVFKHFEDFLIIAVNGDGTESEDFLTRKTLVFVRLLRFFHGPVMEEVGKPKFEKKSDRWNFLRLIMSTWTFLAKNEQSFLMEAVEKLHVNQVVNEQCVEILQTVVTKIQEAGERYTQHALVLVNSKLLSLYSNRNAHELQPADILCIIVLVRSLFPTYEKLEDLFAHTYRNKGHVFSSEAQTPATVKVPVSQRERFQSAVEGQTEGEETEFETDAEGYFSARESYKSKDNSGSDVVDGSNTSYASDKENGTKSPYPEVSERFFTPTVSPSVSSDSPVTEHSVGKKTESLPGTTKAIFFTSGGVPRENAAFLVQKVRELPILTQKSLKSLSYGEELLTASQILSDSRRRSHTASEVEDKVKGRRSNSVGEVVERGRSRSLTEHKKRDVLCSEKSRSHVNLPANENESEITIQTESPDYIKHGVFLTTPICKYSPYQIHCQRIFPGIILVVLTEMPKLSLAPKIVQLLELLKELLSDRKDLVGRAQGQKIYELFSAHLNSVLASLKRSKGPIEKLCQDIRKKWDNEEARTLLSAYLEQANKMDITPTLERTLKALHTKLMHLFLYLYLFPRQLSPAVTETLTFVSKLFMKHLGDYKDYLTVKAQRNITMTTYIEEFPGLIHFIYVNRKTNQIMAPSLNIIHSNEAGEIDATQLVKDKIWDMAEWMHKKLHEGFTSVTAREGDYHFSYFIWFENHAGEAEPVQRPYKWDATAPPPGILTGNFFKYFTSKCFPNTVPNKVHSNELLMMHVGLATTQYITNHCRQLAGKLYQETTGELMTSMSLL